jgi:hypothetical protein
LMQTNLEVITKHFAVKKEISGISILIKLKWFNF